MSIINRHSIHFLLWIVPLTIQANDSSIQEEKNEIIHLAFKGGITSMHSYGSLTDLSAEIQFSLSSLFSLGLELGYLRTVTGMMGDSHGKMMNGGIYGNSQLNHNVQVRPLTINLYYSLPVAEKINVFMKGGSGFYFSTFRDVSTQKMNSFGTHFGIGSNFKLTERVSIVGEALYRFVQFDNVGGDLHPGYRETTSDDNHNDEYMPVDDKSILYGLSSERFQLSCRSTVRNIICLYHAKNQKNSII